MQTPEPTVNYYGGFSARLHQKCLQHRVPLTGSIELTRRCPLRCLQCYNNLPLGDRHARAGEMDCGEIRSLLDAIAKEGCLWLLLTGGEIFAREDFFEIYSHARRKGFLITLFTNGTLITEQIADALVESPPFSIEITLYGRTRETYEAITRVPGSHEQCLQGISRLRERGLPLRLKTMVVTANHHELHRMQRFAEVELGVGFGYDFMINPRIDGSQGPLRFRLSPEEIVRLDLQDPKRAAEWQRIGCSSGSALAGDPDAAYHCGGGLDSFAIDPEGRLSLCVLSRKETYDLRKGSFRQGWEEFLLRVRNRKTERRSRCAACTIRGLCGMCPANGELESGDPDSPLDFFCRVAHARANALGMPPAATFQREGCST